MLNPDPDPATGPLTLCMAGPTFYFRYLVFHVSIRPHYFGSGHQPVLSIVHSTRLFMKSPLSQCTLILFGKQCSFHHHRILFSCKIASDAETFLEFSPHSSAAVQPGTWTLTFKRLLFVFALHPTSQINIEFSAPCWDPMHAFCRSNLEEYNHYAANKILIMIARNILVY